MSYNLSNDAEQPPAPNPPGISASNLRLFKRAGAVLAVLGFVFLILWWARAVYTDLLWFDHLEGEFQLRISVSAELNTLHPLANGINLLNG